MQQSEEVVVQEIKMSVDEWEAIPDNPIQRNTEIHARKARNEHLKKYSPAHARVAAAQLPNGEKYKLDGHTRLFLWQQGSLPAPEMLNVDLYHVKTIQQVEDLYKTFDNPKAGENAFDRVQGAFHKCGFAPKSYLFRDKGVTSAFSHIYGSKTPRNIDVYTIIPKWKDVLKVIDSKDYSRKDFISPILAACMLSIKIYGSKHITFWDDFQNDSGIKYDDKRNAVEALQEVLKTYRSEKKTGTYVHQHEIYAKAISCFEAYRADYWYSKKSGVKPTDIDKYIVRMKLDTIL